MRSDHMVYVVDDDQNVREAVDDLLASRGLSVATFASAREYLHATKSNVPSCLLLDLQLPDVNGLDLQDRLTGVEHPPIVFITGHGDIPSSVRALKAGALDFLPKPVRQEALLQAVEDAIARHQQQRADAAVRDQLSQRYASLTQRERDVLPLVVAGMLNKQAAAKLGISVVTLQIHRGNIMRKMAARSLAHLVRMATRLNIAPEPVSARPRGEVRGSHYLV